MVFNFRMDYNELMKVFKVYKHPKKDTYVAIKIGFAWWPFLSSIFSIPFGLLWLFERRLWLIGVLCFLYGWHYNYVFARDIRIANLNGSDVPIVLALIYYLIWFLVGYKGNKWSHNKLKKKGYPLINTVEAKSRKSAIDLAKNDWLSNLLKVENIS